MYRGRLKKDFDLWVAKGLLPAATAEALMQEYDARPHSFTVGRVLMMLAAVLIAAAILLFVAANWEGMERTLRVGLLLAALWAFHGAAAYTAIKGSNYLPGIFLVLGTATFGASIALIAQMYHISGDGLSANLVWFIMCTVSALLFRSSPLTYFAGLLSWFQFGLLIDHSDFVVSDPWFFATPVQALVVVALAYYTGAMRARHLSYLVGLAWVARIYVDHRLGLPAWQIAVVGTLLFLAAALPASPLHRLARAAGPAPAFYSFVLALMGLLLWQIDAGNFFGSDSSALHEAVPAILAAAFAVLGIALEGRDNGAIRYLGYVVFAGELLYLSMEVIGSMLGTSGIFLLSGLFLGLVAWLVIRLEKRFGARQEPREV